MADARRREKISADLTRLIEEDMAVSNHGLFAKAIRSLLESCKDDPMALFNVRIDGGYGVLHYCAMRGYDHAMEALLGSIEHFEHRDLILNAGTNDMETPLICAAQAGKAGSIMKLLMAGARASNHDFSGKKTAREYFEEIAEDDRPRQYDKAWGMLVAAEEWEAKVNKAREARAQGKQLEIPPHPFYQPNKEQTKADAKETTPAAKEREPEFRLTVVDRDILKTDIYLRVIDPTRKVKSRKKSQVDKDETGRGRE